MRIAKGVATGQARVNMEQLSVLLANFGYNKPLPKYKRLEGVEKSFIEWVTSELQQCTSLTGERKTRLTL